MLDRRRKKSDDSVGPFLWLARVKIDFDIVVVILIGFVLLIKSC